MEGFNNKVNKKKERENKDKEEKENKEKEEKENKDKEKKGKEKEKYLRNKAYFLNKKTSKEKHK